MAEPGLATLAEYETVEVPTDRLTDDDLTRLQALRDRGALTVTETRHGWQIKADAVVGVLTLDRIRLLIEPKFAIDGERLMQWLAYTLAVPVPHEATSRRWTTGPQGYAELAAAALLMACHELLEEGLRRDYLRHDRVQPVLRGRLDFAAQVTRRYGQLDQLHTRTFDRDPDVWENRVLHTALHRAGRLVANPDLARALRSTAKSFPEDPAPSAARATLQRAQYNRLNARYRPAHTWARLLLRGGGVTDLLTDAGLSADSLLLHMPSLWEQVVRRLVSDVASVHGARVVASAGDAAIAVRGDLGKPGSFRPDVLLRLPAAEDGGARWLPMDAKYKAYDRHAVGAADVHQLLTYAAGYMNGTTTAAAIVHPQRADHAHRVLKVTGPRGPLGTVHVVGVDTRVAPQCAAAWVGDRWKTLTT